VTEETLPEPFKLADGRTLYRQQMLTTSCLASLRRRPA
jgi:NAD+ diphosphatase